MKSFKIQIMATVMAGLFIAANCWSIVCQSHPKNLKCRDETRWGFASFAGHSGTGTAIQPHRLRWLAITKTHINRIHIWLFISYVWAGY